jgi:hypothetical protein
MVRRRLHSSSKARVEAFRAKHAGKRRVELFITEHALGCLDRFASAQGQTRSEHPITHKFKKPNEISYISHR